jgi:hypothetical protein
MTEEEFDDDQALIEPDLDDDALDEDDLDVDDEDMALDLDLDEDLGAELDVVEDVEEDEDVVGVDEDEEEDILELEEELHPDDIEAPLDALLQERTASATLEDEEDELEDDEMDIDERGDTSVRIAPRRPGEFLCSSCFLVLPRSQLADTEKMLCRDCA